MAILFFSSSLPLHGYMSGKLERGEFGGSLTPGYLSITAGRMVSDGLGLLQSALVNKTNARAQGKRTKEKKCPVH